MTSFRLHAVISGFVQGVSYRASTRREAARLGLSGWVRNLPDGGVEFVAEGERARVEALLEWARRGPPAARVEALREEWSEAAGEFAGFVIRP